MIVIYIILIVYAVAIASLVYGFDKATEPVMEHTIPITRFSIVVPFRNEAENLPLLLDSFSKLNYPRELFEVILVDDDSSDGFVLESTAYRLLKSVRRSASPKKDAILTAIDIAQFEWIITTDADCEVPETWLAMMDSFLRGNDVEMICGPVAYRATDSFLANFQHADLASLQGATIGSFHLGKGFMCNGANFAYTKTLFSKLNGFGGNEGYPGGDDVFLLQKAMSKFPKLVGYLKSPHGIVHTNTSSTWHELFNQRVRWASKAAGYQSKFGQFLGMVVLLGNLGWIAGLVLFAINHTRLALPGFLILKIAIDYLLILKASRFLKTEVRFHPISAAVYPFFSTAVAVYSVFGKFEWKGRRF
ncbi:MAG: glycosyl transferase [Flavobacterium sp. BFFFF1]|uniref:glycosyltransferase family 2 protein n=1 Tax=Flavobacterium sp. BFFFF1 TaxID=2015557 RepID=UPI000BD968EC|nr:glycosyltransferase [Flavobacterium sp. BFFFF1]OYU81046.1 MAG: glycosyl transferase [Flavobacterium sp. BFFFF1]